MPHCLVSPFSSRKYMMPWDGKNGESDVNGGNGARLDGVRRRFLLQLGCSGDYCGDAFWGWKRDTFSKSDVILRDVVCDFEEECIYIWRWTICFEMEMSARGREESSFRFTRYDSKETRRASHIYTLPSFHPPHILIHKPKAVSLVTNRGKMTKKRPRCASQDAQNLVQCCSRHPADTGTFIDSLVDIR